MKFEIYNNKVIYSDGSTGAVLDETTGKWLAFSFFDGGGLDIWDDKEFTTPKEAASESGAIFS